MTEGGFEFENPEFDPVLDDYDDIDDKLPTVPDYDQRFILNQNDQISNLKEQLKQTALQGQRTTCIQVLK